MVDGGLASPSSTNGEQIYFSLFGILIMEACVLGGQHESEKLLSRVVHRAREVGRPTTWATRDSEREMRLYGRENNLILLDPVKKI